MPERSLKIKGLAFVLLLLAMGTMLPGMMAAAEEKRQTNTFVVIGTETIRGGNTSMAREKAITNALSVAVALMTEEILEIESQVENFQKINQILYDEPAAFVKNYKVLAETASGKSYRVIVQATVAGKKVAERLSLARILRLETTLPTLLLLISEQGLEDFEPRYWWTKEGSDYESISEGTMAETFRQKGYTVIDNRKVRSRGQIDWAAFDKPELNFQEAASLGSRLNADVVIMGTVIASPSSNVMGTDMKSFKGTLSASAIRIDTAESFANLTRTAVAANADEFQGAREALAGVGALAGETLAKEIADVWQKQAQAPTQVELVVEGTRHLSNFVKFRRALSSISGVEGIRVKEMRPNKATLIIDFKGKSKELASALMLQNFDSFGINIYEVTQNSLKIELVQG